MKKVFNFEDIDDFDDHISKSIPNYSGLVDVFTALNMEYMTSGGHTLDIGCSTGNYLKQLPKIKGRYTGIDIIDFNKCHDEDNFDIVKQHAAEYMEKNNNFDVIILMFTLQFMGRKDRKELVEYMKKEVDKGAVILIAEKVFFNNSKVNHVIHREHIRKKAEHFSADETLKKDYELFGSMFCLEDSAIIKELNYIGNPTQVWQSFNFKAWVIS